MKKMLRSVAILGFAAGLSMTPSPAQAGRFGGGGFRAGGMAYRPAYTPAARPASFDRSSFQGSTVHGPYGGSASGFRESGQVYRPAGGAAYGSRDFGAYTGPRGGVAVGGSRSGAGFTERGASWSGGSAGGAYTGPRGGVAVGGARGGTVTGPAGNTVSGGKAGGVVIEPNGNVHAAGREGAAVHTPNGTAVAGRGGAVNVGAAGVTAHGGRVGGVTGVGGAAVAGSRGAVAVGPYGAVAGGSRYGVGFGPRGAAYAGARYYGAADFRNQGAYVRRDFRYYNAFRPGWYGRYPGAWFAGGWAANYAWRNLAWNTYAANLGYAYGVAPIYYDYGNTVVYQEGNVYYGDQPAATETEYATQAANIAAAGANVQPPMDEKWDPLGVFAMVVGDETTSDDIFQLAINKDGIVRGNYYNAKSDTVQPVSGSLDKKTQRIAWSLDSKKDTVFETGLYNLTQENCSMLVHYGTDRTEEQYKLFRVEQPKDGQADQQK